MSNDKKKPDTSPAAGVGAAAEEATDLDAVMRKYDRESATRMWEGTPQLVIRVLMALFGAFCIAMTLFSKDMPEIRLTLFVGCIVIIGFLTYPASKHHVRVNCLPWYDIVLMLVGAGCFFYFALNAMTLVRLSTRIEPVHVIIGVVGILILMELCRRCVGVPILCVAGVLIVYAFINQMSYAVLVGIVSVLLLEGSGSIFYSMLFHICINTTNVVQMLVQKAQGTIMSQEESMAYIERTMQMPYKQALAVSVSVYAVIAAGATALAGCLLYLIVKKENRVQHMQQLLHGNTGEKRTKLISVPLVISVVLCLLYMTADVFWG